MVDLKSCPFCGGEAKRFTIGKDEPNNVGGDVIVCTRCQASSHVEFGRKESLVSSWNRRSTPTEDARSRVKVLEEALGWLAECDNLIVAASKTSDDWEVRRASGQLRGTGPTPIAAIIDARNTALGNKETDRHG